MEISNCAYLIKGKIIGSGCGIIVLYAEMEKTIHTLNSFVEEFYK